jgi:RinA family phage transcriptional activator
VGNNVRWIEDAKRVAYRYKDNCKELERLLRNSNTPNSSPFIANRSGKISKPVEAEVIRLQTNKRIAHLTQSVQAVEYALSAVREKPAGDDTVKLFNMVYYDMSHKLYGAAMELHISEPTAKRYNAYLLKMIAMQMGYLPTS